MASDLSTSLTAARVRELLAYDPDTGEFRWRVSRRYIAANSIAGSIRGSGYRIIKIDQRGYRAHRLAWLYVMGSWPPAEIDHRNGCRADNRWVNLRPATDTENRCNQGKRKNKSGFKGVFNNRPGSYTAQIQFSKRTYWLGSFKTPEAAHAAYIAAALRLHGEFACVGDRPAQSGPHE